MSKAIYVGIGDKARKVPKLYVGVDGVARKVKKGYVGVNGVARLFYSSAPARPPRLPSGYTELEYIYTSGDCRIETDRAAHFETKVVIKAQLFGDIQENRITYLVQSGNSSTSNGQRQASAFSTYEDGNSLFCRIGYLNNSNYESAVPKVQIAQNIDIPFELVMQGNGSCSINGISYSTGSSLSDYLSPVKLKICNKSGTRDIKLYYCQIYENNELEMDLVPCKNAAGMVGMYDLIGNSLFSSATNTSFLAGPAI